VAQLFSLGIVSHFMRISHLTTAALMAAFVIGCSKSPSQQSHQASAPPNTKDLGAVEFAVQTPKQFSLGDGKGCTITARQIPDGIGLMLVLLSTNTDGTVMSSQGQIETRSGQQCAIEVGGTMVGLTPTLKTP
jgi:hypothetical protein